MIIGIVASQQKAAANATVWTYIGVSGSYNGTWVGPTNARGCRTSSAIQTLLNTSKPVSNYPVGYIMRVTHKRECDSRIEPCMDDGTGNLMPISCTTYYYRAD